ncbi:DUF7002 family protein [Sphingomonas bacterium]|uniref:DUF7002 family protein n=1 Tax=Sphingomonas bacterium TaxID=1895847 RepID=UPI003F689FFE
MRRHPRLWHMAADRSWPGIRARGLLSVSGLLDVYGVEGGERLAIESARRPDSVVLARDGLEEAVVRDNKPMYESVLARNLQDGLQPRAWYEILNAKSFFWVDRERLERLLGAKAYAGQPQVVVEVNTRALVDRHGDRVRLCSINSGQTLYGGQTRGLETFRRIEDFPDDGGRLGGPGRPRIVELVVEGGVPDLMELATRADRVANGGSEPLWP